MSKRYKTIVIPPQPEKTQRVVDGHECDKCGADIPVPVGYEVRSFVLEFRRGHDYGSDGDDITTTKLSDLCDACIDEMTQLLVSHGFPFREVGT